MGGSALLAHLPHGVAGGGKTGGYNRLAGNIDTKDSFMSTPSRDDFAALLDETLGGAAAGGFEGRVVKGTITAIENDKAVIDVGLKSEGRVALREFAAPGQPHGLKVGDEVEVYVDRVENAEGEAMLSRDRARREAAWDKLENEFGEGKRVEGVIFGRVKGGFTVDLDGAVAFLPGSQVDIRPVRDVTPLMDVPQPFQILKMDRRRGNIVVSRRAVLEETRAEQRSGLIQNLSEGQIIDGVVKNITDYGAFVDLGGIDGLLHVTDMSYKRVNHPSEVIAIGDTVRVQIVRINHDTQRISLGMKQLRRSVGWRCRQVPGRRQAARHRHQHHRIRRLRGAGAGIEGLVHVSEMSWTKKNVHPGKIVSTSQEVDVLVLEVDSDKRRISLGLKQAQQNPGKLSPSVTPLVRPSRAKSRTRPNSACSSAWMATWTAWSTCRTSPGASRARTRWPCTARVSRFRPWFSTSTSRRSASRSA
jgi:small subunit ribosomal protein S1